ncbi:MAG: hypothetical protein QXU79_00635 [Candidatus Micrarchaeaceae archaeon]
MEEYKTLHLSQLKVNPQNPRYRNPHVGESDAVLALFREIKSRPEKALRHMLNLIDDMIKHGPNPADLPIVVPDPGGGDVYQVMEGNRRIASLKLLYFPELATEVFQGEQQTLRRLEEFRKDFLERFQDRYQNVLCVVYPEPKEARHWVYLRHTGENEGRGITPWDKAARDRFRLQAEARKHTLATQVVDILTRENRIQPDTPVVLSTLERMVKDPDVASRLHLEIRENTVSLSSEPQMRDSALKVLQRIALDTAEEDPSTRRRRLTSRHINRKEERLRYLEQVIARVSPPGVPVAPTEGQTLPLPTSLQVPSPVSELSVLPSRPPAGKDWRGRKCVAARGIKVGHSVLNGLYRELCNLKADAYPQLGIAGIRIFLEGSLDVFLDVFMKRFPSKFSDLLEIPKAPYSIRLSTKLDQVVDFLKDEGVLRPVVAQAIRKYQSNPNNLLSIDTLQAYLHNPEMAPRGDVVKYWWDAYHPLFEALWNTYNAVQK